MSLEVLPPKLVGEIGAHPYRVGKGENPGLGMSISRVGCGEERRSRVEREELWLVISG